jgi:hypothetical protein
MSLYRGSRSTARAHTEAATEPDVLADRSADVRVCIMYPGERRAVLAPSDACLLFVLHRPKNLVLYLRTGLGR